MTKIIDSKFSLSDENIKGHEPQHTAPYKLQNKNLLAPRNYVKTLICLGVLWLLYLFLAPILTSGYTTTRFSEPLWQLFLLCLFCVLLLVGPIASLFFVENAGYLFLGGFLGGLVSSIQDSGRLTSKGVADAVGMGVVMAVGLPIAALMAGPVGLYFTLVKPVLQRTDDATETICCTYGDIREEMHISPSGKWAYLQGVKPGRFWLDDEPGIYWIDLTKGGFVNWKQSGYVYSNPLWVFPGSVSNYDSVEEVYGPAANKFNIIASIGGQSGVSETIDFAQFGFKDFSAEWNTPELKEQWVLNEYTSNNRLVGENIITHQKFDFKVGNGKNVFLVKTTGIAAVIKELPKGFLTNWTESGEIEFWDVGTGKLISSHRISYMPKEDDSLPESYRFVLKNSPDGKVWVINYQDTFWGNYGWVKIIRLDDYFENNKVRLLNPISQTYPTISQLTSETQENHGSQLEDENLREYTSAVSDAGSHYLKSGAGGLIAVVTECYQIKTNDQLHCLYLDLASRRIDQLFVESANLPHNSFFSDEKFGQRIVTFMKIKYGNMDDANQFLATVTPAINSLVEKNSSVAVAIKGYMEDMKQKEGQLKQQQEENERKETESRTAEISAQLAVEQQNQEQEARTQANKDAKEQNAAEQEIIRQSRDEAESRRQNEAQSVRAAFDQRNASSHLTNEARQCAVRQDNACAINKLDEALGLDPSNRIAQGMKQGMLSRVSK